MTAEELNMTLGDPTVNLLPDIDPTLLFNIIVILSGSAIIAYILSRLVTQFITEMTKDKINIPNPLQWFKNKYSQYKNEQVLPLYRPKKAKESPFVGPMPPVVLPSCPILDGAEKGQNLKVRFSIPYRRFPSSENLVTSDEHRITITTVVESTPKDPN